VAGARAQMNKKTGTKDIECWCTDDMLLRLRRNFDWCALKWLQELSVRTCRLSSSWYDKSNYKIIIMTMMASSPFFWSSMDVLGIWWGGKRRFLVGRLMVIIIACRAIWIQDLVGYWPEICLCTVFDKIAKEKFSMCKFCLTSDLSCLAKSYFLDHTPYPFYPLASTPPYHQRLKYYSWIKVLSCKHFEFYYNKSISSLWISNCRS